MFAEVVKHVGNTNGIKSRKVTQLRISSARIKYQMLSLDQDM